MISYTVNWDATHNKTDNEVNRSIENHIFSCESDNLFNIFGILCSLVLRYVVLYCLVLFFVVFFMRLCVHVFASRGLTNSLLDFVDVPLFASQASGVRCRLLFLVFRVRFCVSRLVSFSSFFVIRLVFVLWSRFVPGRSIVAQFP